MRKCSGRFVIYVKGGVYRGNGVIKKTMKNVLTYRDGIGSTSHSHEERPKWINQLPISHFWFVSLYVHSHEERKVCKYIFYNNLAKPFIRKKHQDY